MLEQNPSSISPPLVRPVAIQIFGILHLVFAGFGLLGAIIGIPLLLFMEPLADLVLGLINESDPAGAETFQVIADFYLSQRTIWLVASIISLIGAILLLRAGLALIKSRKNSVLRSNIWCYFFIIYSLVSIPVTLMVSLPAQTEFQRKLEGSASPGGATVSSETLEPDTERLINVGSAVFGGVVSLIYPGLALGFLNRKNVKDYLAQQES